MTDESQRWRADRARDYLEHVRGLSRSLESRQQEIEALRSKMLPQGIVYGGMPGSPNAYGDAIPDGIAKLEALIASYCDELAQCIAEVEAAHRALNRMDSQHEAEALRRYYLAGQSWELVCVEMHYTWNGMMTLRRRALANLYGCLPLEWKMDIPEAV